MSPTQPKSCEGCPLYGVGKGFVLGVGNAKTAKFAAILEAPGSQETSFTITPNAKRSFLSTQQECDEEIRRRQCDYPNLSNGYIRNGVPAVGPTGLALEFWIWAKVGIRRSDVFIDNTIRCLPPKSKSGAAYPTGETKKMAEKFCRQYDRVAGFRPDTIVFSIHPASLLREITPLPLVIKDWERVRDFTTAGRRVLTLIGSKAVQAFAGFGSNVGKWRSHYFGLTGDWGERYKEMFAYEGKVKRTKKVVAKPEELTPVPCKNVNRYKGKNPPKCACVVCWGKYEGLCSATEVANQSR
jgi:uracil-DNA glycosylase